MDVGTIFEMCSGDGASKEQEGLTINEALDIKCLDYLRAFLGLDEEIIKREFKNIDEDGDGRVTLKESQTAFKYLRAPSPPTRISLCNYLCLNMKESKVVDSQNTCPPNYNKTNIPNPNGMEPYSKICTFVGEQSLSVSTKRCNYGKCVETHETIVDNERMLCPKLYPYPKLLKETEGPCYCDKSEPGCISYWT